MSDLKRKISTPLEIEFKCWTYIETNLDPRLFIVPYLKQFNPRLFIKNIHGLHLTKSDTKSRPCITSKNVSDVLNLIKKHYGNDWRELEVLSYYKNVIDRQQEYDRIEFQGDGGNWENTTSQENALI